MREVDIEMVSRIRIGTNQAERFYYARETLLLHSNATICKA